MPAADRIVDVDTEVSPVYNSILKLTACDQILGLQDVLASDTPAFAHPQGGSADPNVDIGESGNLCLQKLVYLIHLPAQFDLGTFDIPIPQGVNAVDLRGIDQPFTFTVGSI